MSETPADQYKVLIVDDDMSFLQMVRDVFSNASGGAWEVQTATSGGDALQRLRSKRVDLAVIDVFMPGMDGLQLLGVLHQEFPTMPKVMLTGMPDAATRTVALEGGAALFLEKPASAAGYESFFATLNELLRWNKRFSSRGLLGRVTLLDLVKLECKSGNSRLFEVHVEDVRGEIYIKEGVIIHAIMPDRRGQSAFTSLTTTPGAVFYLREYQEPIERSVERQWEFLVMEAAHVKSQLAELPPKSEKPAPATSSSPATPLPPSSASSAASPLKLATPQPPRAKEPPRAEPALAATPLPVLESRPRVFKAGSPPPTTLETKGSSELKLAEAPDALPFESSQGLAGFKVEELLLCTDFKEVVHESNCANTHRRLQLAGALVQKGRAFATQLPLGELERVELNSTGGRVVIRCESKRCLLVRTNTKWVQPVGNPAAKDAPDEWLAGYPPIRGVLAVGVLTTDGRMHHRSFVAEYPEELTRIILREAAHLNELALKHGFPAWLTRMLYDRSQLYSFRRQDGAVMVAFLLRTATDKSAVERFFKELTSVRAV